MLKERETPLRRFIIFVDSVVIALSFFLAYLMKGALRDPGEPLRIYILILAIPLWCLTLYANDIYLSMRTRSYLEILWSVVKSAILTFLIMGTAVYFFKRSETSRLFFILFGIFSFAFILLEKTAIFMSAHYVRRQGLNTRRLLIVVTGKRAQEFTKRVDAHPEWGFLRRCSARWPRCRV